MILRLGKKNNIYSFLSYVCFFRYNMQKVTYVLLQRHANNYWQIDRDEDIRNSGMEYFFLFV